MNIKNTQRVIGMLSFMKRINTKMLDLGRTLTGKEYTDLEKEELKLENESIDEVSVMLENLVQEELLLKDTNYIDNMRSSQL